MKIIGLTGGIGSGKSTVSSYLTSLGYVIIDADRIAREITEAGSPVLPALAGAFGRHILNADGSLDRKKLGQIVFADAEKKSRLEKITHIEILKVIDKQISWASEDKANKLVFLDAPLMFETGLDAMTDMVWLVDADRNIRVKRVMERDKLSKEEIENRIKCQMPTEEKLEKADRVIDNSGDKAELYQQIDKLLEEHV